MKSRWNLKDNQCLQTAPQIKQKTKLTPDDGARNSIAIFAAVTATVGELAFNVPEKTLTGIFQKND